MKIAVAGAVLLVVFTGSTFAQDDNWIPVFVKEKQDEIQNTKNFIIIEHLRLKNYGTDVANLVNAYSEAQVNSAFVDLLNPNAKNFGNQKSFIDIIVDSAKKSFSPGDKGQNDANFAKALDNATRSSSLYEAFSSFSPVVGVVSNVLSVVNNLFSFNHGTIEAVNKPQSMDQFTSALKPYISFYENISSINAKWNAQLSSLKVEIDANNLDFKTLESKYKGLSDSMGLDKNSLPSEIENRYGFTEYSNVSVASYSNFAKNSRIRNGYNLLKRITEINEKTAALLKEFQDLQSDYNENWIQACEEMEKSTPVSDAFRKSLKKAKEYNSGLIKVKSAFDNYQVISDAGVASAAIDFSGIHTKNDNTIKDIVSKSTGLFKDLPPSTK